MVGICHGGNMLGNHYGDGNGDDDDDDIDNAADDDDIDDVASGKPTWFNIRVYTVLPTAWPTRLLAVIFFWMVLIIISDYNLLSNV